MIMFVFWLLLVVASVLVAANIGGLLYGDAGAWLCLYADVILLFLFRRRITRWFERRLRSLRRKTQQRQTTASR